jgi:hypothetical protein
LCVFRAASTEQLADTHNDEYFEAKLKTFNVKSTDSVRESGYASVFMIKLTRVAEKGYKSAEIFQKLGNAFYFNDELDKAARWYAELFAITLIWNQYIIIDIQLLNHWRNNKTNEMLASSINYLKQQ